MSVFKRFVRSAQPKPEQMLFVSHAHTHVHVRQAEQHCYMNIVIKQL